MQNNIETTIINCKVKYIRPYFKNLKDWIEHENNIYIGRKGIVFVDTDKIDENRKKIKERFPKKDSIWANPFKVKKNNNGDSDNRNIAIENYKKYIIKKIQDENLYEELLSLEGKNLGCWCKEPNKYVPCHGDILLQLLQNYKDNLNLNII
tara:strand:+ start:491 stop:943 length:453 start_codon:yes stop_codon:yes gene_type:complete